MADNAGGQVVAGNVAPAAGQGQAGVNTWSMVKGFVFRMLIIYVISSFLRGWRGTPETKNSTISDMKSIADGFHNKGPSNNLYHRGFKFDLYVFLSESEQKFNDFNNTDSLFWLEEAIEYGDWKSGPSGDGSRTHSGVIPCTENLQKNGSIYVHVFVVPTGKSPNPVDKMKHSRTYTLYHSKRLNKYKKKRYQKTQNLLTGETQSTEEEILKAQTIKSEVLSHWHPNLTINMIDDHTQWTKGSLPSPLDETVRFDPVNGDYQPIFFFNEYWNLNADYMPINDTVKALNLSLTYTPMSLFKWQIYASQNMRNKWSSLLGSEFFEEEEDQDSLKQAILETNPYLLGMTIVVSILHTIFEFMAFKNDIQFWRNRKSLEGLSVRSVLFNIFTSGIVLLYVLDNETNFVVRCSIGIGLLIELWKVPKVMDVTIDRQRPLLGFLPRVTFADKGSYVESSTKQYDNLAFKYLSWVLFPLLGGYAVYSLIYHEHRGWYSFVLSMLYGFLLTFGFIMMTPQLFINYKLKSVAHLPWRMLTYKFLNTFIDDIFAFVIKMPTLYRIGCFRDDIVFLIYVYQRWIYRVDHSRLNEFGVSGEDLAQAATEGTTNDETSHMITSGEAFVNGNLPKNPLESDSESNLLRQRKNVGKTSESGQEQSGSEEGGSDDENISNESEDDCKKDN